MMRLISVVLLAFLGLPGVINDPQQDLEVQPKFITPCTTPNRDVGVCVEIQKCPIFMDGLRRGKNDNYDFIRASRCGPSNEDNKQPKVCCGRHDNYLNKVITSTTTTVRPTQPTTDNTDVFPKTCRTPLEAHSRMRIVGGMIAKLTEFPWMARLRHRRSDDLLSYGCSGFLISENFVLTAAHCVRSKKLEPLGPIYQVQLGEYNTETDPDCVMGRCADTPQLLEIAEPIVHPEYSGDHQQHNDIAVIPLKKPAKFTEYVHPICLPSTLSHQPKMTVSGWGTTESENSSPIKLKVVVPRTNQSDCVDIYRPIGIRIQESQICAGGEEGHDSCTGDSGGPIMVLVPSSGWYAEGIVSFGKGCGVEGWPGVYTNIPYYMPWIKKVVNQHLEGHVEKNEESTTKMKGGGT